MANINKKRFDMELWIARDKNGSLYLYDKKPLKHEDFGFFESLDSNGYQFQISCKYFPEVTFENSPKQVKMELV